MLRPSHVIARLHKGRWQLARLEVQLRAQQRKIEVRYLDTPHLMPCLSGSFGIGISHRVQQVMAGRIWMALDNCNTLGHSPIPMWAAAKFLFIQAAPLTA
jgi:hypothetical protein